ncbi:helix-hairpin-helix domain-containing protein [Desulforudis sp. 1190]
MLKAFPSLEAIKQAGVDELAAVPGMNRKVAEAVYRFFLRDE